MTTVITAPVPSGSNVEQGQFRLLYDNLFDVATSVVASSEDVDFPVENAYDWLMSDFFKPASGGAYTITSTFSNVKTANCMALYNHDLHTNSGTIQLQYWDGAAWQNATDAIAPVNGEPKIIYFNAQSSTQWRFSIDSTQPSSIGVLFFGEYLGLELGVWQGFTPPRFSKNNNYITNVAQNGSFLGRSIVTQSGNISLKVEYMTMQWARDEWEPFIEHIELKPFFFSWNVANYPDEHAFAWSTDTSFNTSNQTFDRMESTIKMRVIV